MRIGSLFSGGGGLDMAVEHMFGGATVWHCENDAAATKVLAYRWPGVPNLGDITKVDWRAVEPVDVLCGGWPCQPFSMAGKRLGASDERALWPYVAGAVRMVRPRWVVLENVSAVLGVGEFQRVADDLAEAGYEFAWTCVRAADVGAPHRRERLFVLAYPTGTERRGTQPEHLASPRIGAVEPRKRVGAATFSGRSAADSDESGRGTSEPYLLPGQPDTVRGGDGPVDLLPTPNAADGNGGGRYSSDGHQNTLPGEVRLLPTPRTREYDNNPSGQRRNAPGIEAVAYHFPTGQWGRYEAVIRRWEQATRPAPPPTEPNSKGNPRLNPAFSEWMMGWPHGWVTAVPSVSRNDQLKIIGNGVCPQQATAALQWLLSLCGNALQGVC